MWRRKKRVVATEKSLLLGVRISQGKTSDPRLRTSILNKCSYLIHRRATDGFGKVSKTIKSKIGRSLVGSGLPINLLAVACCELCGNVRRRGKRKAHWKNNIIAPSLDRRCPSKQFKHLNRTMVHYWKNHRDYPKARFAIKSAIAAATCLQHPSIDLTPFMRDGLSRVFAACLSSNTDETLNNLRVMAALMAGENIDKPRADRLTAEL
jgi:hypothetical protein